MQYVLFLMILLALGVRESVAQQQCLQQDCRTTQISFNTAVNHNTGALYLAGQSADAFWAITQDPDPATTEPRRADVTAAQPGWSTLPGSGWLRRYQFTGNDPVVGTTRYETEFLACNATMGALNLTVSVPNQGRIYFNGMLLLAIPQPGIPPTSLSIPGINVLPGTNVLAIEVDNISGVASGLNMIGTLTTMTEDLITRACGPQKNGFTLKVFDDLDIDGIYNPDDPPMPGVLVELSSPALGTLEQISGPTGEVWFEGAVSGIYTLTVTPLPGYGITVGTTHTVTLAAGASAIGLKTGMSSCASICVAKFNDRNCNGQRDPGEEFLPGWVINYSDGQQAITLSNLLVCKKVCASTTITLTEVIPPGTCWVQTFPVSGSHTINPIPGKSITVYFGNSSTGTLCVNKFNDLNGNGQRDPGEPGLPNWSFTVTAANFSTVVKTGADGEVCISVTCGTYTVCEVTQAGWCATTPLCVQATVAACSVRDVEFGNASTGTLCVFKFNDVNCNGFFDPNESPLPNWSFQFNNGAGTVLAAQTDGAGIACVSVTAGTWTVCEQLPNANWVATLPACQIVTLGACESADLVFGNSSTGTLCVKKFNDLNGNGQHDPGEPFLPNWTFTLTGPGGVLTVTTDSTGTACVPVTAGTWTACETLQAGWTPTTPMCQTTGVLACQSTTALFGNASTGTLCITKFNDLNCDGVQNPGEPSLPGWSFTVTGGGSTMTMTTGPSGITCATVTAGTYVVCEITQAGWKLTTPTCVTVTVVPSGVAQVTFGNASTGTVCGFKYHDIDGDGTFSPGDTALPNWTIRLYDASGTTLLYSGQTDATGLYCFENIPLGDYVMKEVWQQCWEQTEPPLPIDGYAVPVTPCCYTEYPFGNRDTCDPCETSLCITKFNDLNCDGVQNPGEPSLPGWSFTITDAGGGTITVTTGAAGVTCATVTAGTYVVCEVTQAGWKLTTPTCVTITVVECSTAQVTFGNASTGTVCGFKYHDIDGDGTFSPGDTALPNWTIRLYDASGTTLLYSGQTDATGLYCFENIPLGDYVMKEVWQQCWEQTEPPLPIDGYAVPVTPCCYTEYPFGNRDTCCTQTEICVTKYNDRNCNGQRDPGEETLSGWAVFVTPPGGGPTIASGVTGPTGEVCMNVPSGTYEVHEVFPPAVLPWCGWVQTYPIKVTGQSFHTVTVSTCLSVSVAFGNSSTGTLCITKFDDIDCDGQQDPGEPGIEGWRFTVTAGTVSFTAVTGPDGKVCVSVTCAEWTICEETRACWSPTTDVCQIVGVSPCATTNVVFGNSSTGTLCITKFNDVNCNGVREPGEVGLPGWQFIITRPDGTSFPISTGPGGRRCIRVPCGTYTVCEVTRACWTATTPECVDVTVVPCETSETTFGNSSTGTLCLTKFNDLNGNGKQDPGEPGIVGWPINVPGVGIVLTATNGTICIPVTCGTYIVCELITQANWVPTTPVCDTVTVVPCQIASATFGNWQPQPCTAWICGTKYWDRPTADGPCDGAIGPNETGLAYWEIEVYETTTGTLLTTVVTDQNGNYCVQLPPGTYTISEIPKWGFMVMYPPGGSHTLTVNCGDSVTDAHFLNCACPQPPGGIHCATDSLHVLSNPALFNGNTVLVAGPPPPPFPRNGIALPPPLFIVPPIGLAQWIGPNPPGMFPPCPPCIDPPGDYIWRRDFCVCEQIDSTVVHVRLCFEGVDYAELWLDGQLLGTYTYPNPPTCVDTMVKIRSGCLALEFRVRKFPVPPGAPAPAGLSYEGSIVGPGLIKDECCDCYKAHLNGNPHGLIEHPQGEDAVPGIGRSDGASAVTDVGGNALPTFDPVLTSVPNPTSGATTVSYSLRSASEVRLELYNAVGRHVLTLREGQQTAGRHSVPLDMSELPSGFYHLRLTVDGSVYTLRIVSSK